jgi:hypothetical protein
MRLITVTRKIDGKKMYVTTINICAIYPRYDNDVTCIQFAGAEENYLEVMESVDTVAKMVEGEG